MNATQIVQALSSPALDAEPLLSRVARVIKAASGCTDAQAEARAREACDLSAPLDFSPWRHGGWYVGAVRYPSGAVGCVSRNYADRKWRIVCDPRPFETAPTFKDRTAAARAEQALALSLYTPERIAEELRAAEETRRAIAEREERASVARFRVGDAEPCTLAELVKVNADDTALCAWADVATVGDVFPDGAGCERIA